MTVPDHPAGLGATSRALEESGGPIYVETSAWAKLIKDEAESDAFVTFADAHLDGGGQFVASILLHTELHRLAKRFGIEATVAQRALSQVTLFVPDAGIYRVAGAIGDGLLRSLDALHVAHCLELGVGAMATYDERQSSAARSVGITVLSPA